MSRIRIITILFIGALFIGASFFVGVYAGYAGRPEVEWVGNILHKEFSMPPREEVDFMPFWKAWNILEDKFAPADGSTSRQEMLWGAISGLTRSLDDPYTTFFPPQEKEIFESSVRGDFEGVGMEIGIRQNVLTVIAPIKDTPAWRAGIKAGDRIAEIDKESADGISVEEAVKRIRGPKGSTVTFLIIREGAEEPLKISVVRDVVVIPNIETETKESGIFVIRLSTFSERAPQLFREALREMIQKGQYGLVLDLRNNPGGFLEVSVDIASWFLPPGEIVARERFNDGREKLYRSKGYDIFNNLSMAVLVNKGSASASEILAGALKEHGVAIIVGEQTFGKGSVQELVPVTDNTSLKITVARWFTPEGNTISEKGLTPDVEIAQDPKDTEQLADTQLKRALEIVREGIAERGKVILTR
ncbi:MAG: S41 family peptidase [Parcubacteria group bacterium]|nr:S41 family peptidase [Parcubacteria group bacterium]